MKDEGNPVPFIFFVQKKHTLSRILIVKKSGQNNYLVLFLVRTFP